MFILFLMMLCTTVCLHGMEGAVNQKRGTFNVIGYDTIYSNHETDDGKGGSKILYTGAPLCLIGSFIYTDNPENQEDLMIPIDAYRGREKGLDGIPDGTDIVFKAHKTGKPVCLFMSQRLRDKIQEALGK
jgi:hypothetical protein